VIRHQGHKLESYRKPHDRFKRQDTDLITDIEVDLLTALGGGQLLVKHLDDRALPVHINLVPERSSDMVCFMPFVIMVVGNSYYSPRRTQGHTQPGYAISATSRARRLVCQIPGEVPRTHRPRRRPPPFPAVTFSV
jgi:hypothetical protein